MGKVLSRTDFLAASSNRKRELVDVPELGGSVYLRELSTGQLLEYNDRIEKLRGAHSDVTPAASLELMSLMISMSACDEEGVLLFTEADVKALAENSIGVIIGLSTKAMEVSGIGKAVIEEVAAELKKVPTDSSATG
jgi:hypothetical protein